MICFFIKRWELKKPTLSPWHTHWPPYSPDFPWRTIPRTPLQTTPLFTPNNQYLLGYRGGGVDTRTWLPALPSLLCIPVVCFNFCRRDLFSHWRTLSLSMFRNSSMLFLSIAVWSLILANLKLFIPNGRLMWHTSFDTVSIPNGMTSKQVKNINSFPVRFYFRVSVPNYYKTLLRNKSSPARTGVETRNF